MTRYLKNNCFLTEDYNSFFRFFVNFIDVSTELSSTIQNKYKNCKSNYYKIIFKQKPFGYGHIFILLII